MPAVYSLLAIVTGLGSVVCLWPMAGAWSLAAAPFIASLATAGAAVFVASRAVEAAGEPILTTDEMVAALRSVLPREGRPADRERERKRDRHAA